MPDPTEKADRVDPADLAETLADAPAIRPERIKPAASLPPGDPALDDTAVDMDADAPPSRRSGESGVELDSVFDRPDAQADTASLTRFDPEAGKTNVAIKIKAATEALRNTISTPFGKLILAIIVGLAGVSLAIAAVTLRDTPYIIAACLVAPIGFLLVYWRYQAWLGHKRYMYRLLETLGEDVTDFDPHRMYRRVGKKIKKG